MTLRSVDAVLREHRSITGPSEIRCHGHNFVAMPGVFCPLLAPSGFLELSFLAWPIFNDKTILDIGSGSGISSCLFALNGANRVTGVDINPMAIESGRLNARQSDVAEKVSFLLGDVFDPVETLDGIDICFANLPFSSGRPADMLERAFFDPGLFSIRKFLQGVAESRRLQQGMRAFVCTSNLERHDLPEHASMLGLRWMSVMTIELGWVELTLTELLHE